MENLNDTLIYRDEVLLTIIVNGQNVVDPNSLEWSGDRQEGHHLTLQDISQQLELSDIHGVFTVWQEAGLSGVIYQYGNYHPASWVKHGTTKGYA